MKGIYLRIIAAAALLSLAPAAWSLEIVSGDSFNGTDVGSIDTILGQTTDLNSAGDCGVPGNSSAPKYEECWAENVLNDGTDLIFEGSPEDVAWYNTDQAGVIAFQLIFGPGYYIVKNGSPNTGGWVLLANAFEFDWGALDTNALNIDLNLGSDMIISHVTEFNGGQQVPEPGSLALLGVGLLALGALRGRVFGLVRKA